MSTHTIKTLLAALTMAISIAVAQARIGETVAEFENGKPTKAFDLGNGSWLLAWQGKRIEHAGFFSNGKAWMETFRFRDGRELSAIDIEKFLKPYAVLNGNEAKIKGDAVVMDMFDPDDGSKIAVAIYKQTDSGAYVLQVWNATRYAASHPEPTPAPRYAAPKATQELDFSKLPDQPSQEAEPLATSDRRDCAVVATENLKRLQPISYWATILMFDYTVDGQKLPIGHAMCAWKVGKESRVMVIDADGTLELPTTSTDSREILSVLGSRYSKLYGRTIVMKGHSSDDGTDYRAVGEAIGYWGALLLFLGLYIWAIIVCFMKGKPIFALLSIVSAFIPFVGWLPIIGALRIAKPESRWARKKYGPEKMDIAHRRFTPVYNEVQKATPVIIDDPVERALERVRRHQVAAKEPSLAAGC